MISRYLACFDLNVGMLAGGESQYVNIVSIARELGSIALSFPNTPNMRELSGVDTHFQRQYNVRLLQKMAATPPGSMCFIAANGTMENKVNGVYPISSVKKGTRTLVRNGWDVIPVASAHDIDEPFSVAGELIPAADVDDEVIHQSMKWIARTLSDRDVPAIYGH